MSSLSQSILESIKVKKRVGKCHLLLRKMQEKQKIIIVWYKRDLRISDHPPLTDALSL